MQQGAELRDHAEDAQELSVLPLQAVREGGHEAQLGPRRQRLQDGQGEMISRLRIKKRANVCFAGESNYNLGHPIVRLVLMMRIWGVLLTGRPLL